MTKKCLKCGFERLPTSEVPDYECPNCGAIYAKVEAALSRSKGEGVPPSAVARSRNQVVQSRKEGLGGTKSMLGWTGSIALLVSVFAPIVSVPLQGEVRYFDIGKAEGVLVVVLTITAFVFVLSRKFGLLWVPGIGSLGYSLIAYDHYRSLTIQAKARLERLSEMVFLPGMEDPTLAEFPLEWGWALLCMGALLLIASAAIDDRSRKNG